MNKQQPESQQQFAQYQQQFLTTVMSLPPATVPASVLPTTEKEVQHGQS